tara:strand:+ start:20 stop:565 length:546 start_codon:yes stop_codon:yes gene_type:complete
MRYKVNTPPTNIPEERDARLSLFQKKNDKNLFNMIDSENIKLSGSKIKVYKYLKSNDIDDIYMESRQKTISPEPVVVWGHFDPRPIEENLSQFGVEIQYDQVFNFNKSYVESILGSPIEPGDILEPEFQDIKFEVYEVQEDSFEAYGVYHLLVNAKVLRDTQDIHNEDYFDRSDNTGGRAY